MVLQFANGTTLTSPYSNVWNISFSPASNQTIGNTTTGLGATPPGGEVVDGGGGEEEVVDGGGGEEEVVDGGGGEEEVGVRV
jgi:hypothetical protein